MNNPVILAVTALVFTASACAPQVRQPSPTESIVTTTVPATTTTTVSVERATEDFRSCLRDNDLDIPPIPFDSQGRPRLELAMVGVDFSDPEAVQALTQCSDHLVEGALELSAWPSLQENVQNLLMQFSDCVRSQGVVTFPDPVRPFRGVGGPYPLEEIPYDHPDLEEAVFVCSSRMVGSRP